MGFDGVCICKATAKPLGYLPLQQLPENQKDVKKQKMATALFTDLLKSRKDLLMKQDPSSTTQVELKRSNNLQPCIVYSSFGK